MSVAEHIEHASTAVKSAGDVAAGSLIIGAMVGWLPAVAAGFSIVWYCILIYGKVQTWRRTKTRARRRK